MRRRERLGHYASYRGSDRVGVFCAHALGVLAALLLEHSLENRALILAIGIEIWRLALHEESVVVFARREVEVPASTALKFKVLSFFVGSTAAGRGRLHQQSIVLSDGINSADEEQAGRAAPAG